MNFAPRTTADTIALLWPTPIDHARHPLFQPIPDSLLTASGGSPSLWPAAKNRFPQCLDPASVVIGWVTIARWHIVHSVPCRDRDYLSHLARRQHTNPTQSQPTTEALHLGVGRASPKTLTVEMDAAVLLDSSGIVPERSGLAKDRNPKTGWVDRLSCPRNIAVTPYMATGSDSATCRSNPIGRHSTASKTTKSSLHGPARIRNCFANSHFVSGRKSHRGKSACLRGDSAAPRSVGFRKNPRTDRPCYAAQRCRRWQLPHCDPDFLTADPQSPTSSDW